MKGLGSPDRTREAKIPRAQAQAQKPFMDQASHARLPSLRPATNSRLAGRRKATSMAGTRGRSMRQEPIAKPGRGALVAASAPIQAMAL